MDSRTCDDLARSVGPAGRATGPTSPSGRATRGAVVALSQLSPGPHTFTAKHALTLNPQGMDPRVSDRSLDVIPLP